MGAKRSVVVVASVLELEDSDDELAGKSGTSAPKNKRKVNAPEASSALFEKVTAMLNRFMATLEKYVSEAQTQLDAEKK